MTSRWSRTAGARGDAYDARWTAMEARGENPHGEVDLLERLGATSVLDAGCGTGRVARELARRGHEVVGVDLDPAMLAPARRKAPELTWIEADLTRLELGRRFHTVVLAGNVVIFLEPGTEADALSRCAAHLEPGGLLVAGFQVRPGALDPAGYDTAAGAAGLEPVERWSTWDGDRWVEGGSYVVSVHRRA